MHIVNVVGSFLSIDLKSLVNTGLGEAFVPLRASVRQVDGRASSLLQTYRRPTSTLLLRHSENETPFPSEHAARRLNPFCCGHRSNFVSPPVVFKNIHILPASADVLSLCFVQIFKGPNSSQYSPLLPRKNDIELRTRPTYPLATQRRTITWCRTGVLVCSL